jgi:DNA-binding beta-propeller fold protein YncE
MRRWKFCSMLTLALGFGALGCGGGSTATSITIAVSPSTASVITNTTQTFSAFVTGSSDQVATWTVTCPTGVTAPACGTIDMNSGVYTAPKTVPTVTTNGTTTITPTATITATAHADATKTGTATVTIVSGISISISPTTATVGTGEHFTFTANVNNPGCDNTVTSNNCLGVTWSVPTTAGVGTIDASGNYTAPATAPSPSTVTITATSVKDTAVTATATATVVTAADPTLTSVSPKTAALGSLFQDVYITGTNFISTNNVFVNGNLVSGLDPNSSLPLVSVASSSLIRVRILATSLSVPPPSGILAVTVARQTGTPQNCSPDITQCQLVLSGVRPAITGPSPDNIQQGSTGALNFDINGGFFGIGGSGAVNATYMNQPRPIMVTSPRQMSVTIGGSGTNSGDFSTPGLYPVAVHSGTDPAKVAVTNIAVQPNYAAGLSSITSQATVPLGAGASPSDIAINPATGVAVVVNTGTNDATLIDLKTFPPAIIAGGASICTAAVGASAPCPSSGPKSVAVDYIRNLALVVNTTAKTIAAIDLKAMAVTSATQQLQDTPVAVGINPVSGRALVTIQNKPYGLILDLTQSPPVIVGPVTISTGLNSHVAVEPHLNWAVATPGGIGSIGIVDLNRQTVNNVTSISRSNSVVTVTVQASTTAVPQPPLALVANDTVLIQGVSDTTFNGFYTVNPGPQSGQFTYTQTGQPDKASFSTAGTVNYSEAVARIQLSTSFQGIGINPETQQAVLVDPSTSGVVSFLSLLDQTSTPLTLRGPNNGPVETGSVAGAFNPLTNVAVTVNPSNSTLSVIDPSTPTRLTSTTSFPSVALAGPVAVALDPGTNVAVVANQTNNTVSVLSLGATIQPVSITETSPKTFVANSTLASPAPPAVQQLMVIGTGFSTNSRVRLDGITLSTTFVSSRQLTATVQPSQLATAHRFALDVLDLSSNAVTNASDFTVTQSIDVSTGCSTSPLPAGVAIDPDQNIAAVSLSGCTTVALIDLSTGTGQAVTVGTNPLGVAVLPRLHKAVVANNGSNNASVVDELAASVTNTITTGSGSVGVAADQDTGEAAVANSVANTVTILNAASGGTASLSTGQRPIAVAFDYQTHQVAVAATASNSVGIAAASSGTVATSFSLSVPTSVAYDPATDTFLAASSTNNSVSIYNPTTLQQVGFFRVGINPTAIAFNYQTGTLISTNTISHTVTVADILSNRIRAVLTLPPPPVNSTLALSGALQFAVDIHPLTNVAVIADTANGRVLVVPVPR